MNGNVEKKRPERAAGSSVRPQAPMRQAQQQRQQAPMRQAQQEHPQAQNRRTLEPQAPMRQAQRQQPQQRPLRKTVVALPGKRRPLLLYAAVAGVVLVAAAIALPGLRPQPAPHKPAAPAVSAPRDPAGAPPAPAAAAPPAGAQTHRLTDDVAVPVYLSKRQTVATVPLEDYVRGVVAAEMPIAYEPEALKAQALAARTYIVRRIAEGDTSGVPVSGALVTDTVMHQAYLTDTQLAERWTGDAYERNMDKLQRAVSDTAGLILTYEGKPINATFFSTSNGYTEDAGNVWQFSLPYLHSVASPWDLRSPVFKETKTLTYADLTRMLGVKSIATSAANTNGIRVLKRTEGGRIASISIGGHTFTGIEIREKLGLRSADFTFRWVNPNKGKAAQLEITTYGYGHGVGMSQFGANALAQEGQTAEQIVRYYYQGISVSEASDQMLARAY